MLRNNQRLANCCFWAGLMFGMTMIMVLYARVYCSVIGGCGTSA
jgi:hypothetical protein